MALAVDSAADDGDGTRVTVGLGALGTNPGETWVFSLDDGWGNVGGATVVMP